VVGMGLQEADLKYTSSDSLNGIVDKLKATFESGRTLPVSYRKKQLTALVKMLQDNTPAFRDALWKDLRKGEFETDLWEVNITISEANHMLSHIDEWAKYVTFHVKTQIIHIFILKSRMDNISHYFHA
jgi:acyl-CoA reductase-like NAD-dependent aldehyde dehydrogenase